jgi:hypothetical protein
MTLPTQPHSTFDIHAKVADAAITKVSRLFNASLDDITNELLQNARRAGATQVAFDQYTDPEMGDVIRIVDNGPGITSPNTLFSLGEVGWDHDTCASEDAAGMGFFSLAGRTVRIIAQQAGTNASYILDAAPDAFCGKEPIIGKRGPDGIMGVTILIAAKTHENIVPIATKAAKYCSIDVSVAGTQIAREDFLASALHIETWKGIRIGVWQDTHRRAIHEPDVNFHGLTLRAQLPTLSQEYNAGFSCRIDVESCADLKLVLPARKEIVQDTFYDALKTKISKVYFELVQKAGAHSLSFENHQRAHALGITLLEAVNHLRPFSPAHADTDSNAWNQPEPVHADALICAGGDEAADDQNLTWALEHDEGAIPLYDPKSAFKGYTWYDALKTVEITGYVRVCEGRRYVTEIGATPDILERPAQLFIIGLVQSDKDTIPWQLETDLILFAQEGDWVDDTILCLTATCTITVPDLVDFMTRALFCPSDDNEAGSYDSQLQWFTDQAEDEAIAYLQTLDDVHRNQVERVLRRELYWIIKPSSAITIGINGTDVSINGLASAFKKPVAA